MEKRKHILLLTTGGTIASLPGGEGLEPRRSDVMERELALLRADLELDYDNGVPEGAAEQLTELLGREELIIQKRTKRKEMADVDIAPMIRSVELYAEEGKICAQVVVQAQNPGLNPQLLERAIANYLPELTPDFVRVRRRELLDIDGKIFR